MRRSVVAAPVGIQKPVHHCCALSRPGRTRRLFDSSSREVLHHDPQREPTLVDSTTVMGSLVSKSSSLNACASSA